MKVIHILAVGTAIVWTAAVTSPVWAANDGNSYGQRQERSYSGRSNPTETSTPRSRPTTTAPVAQQRLNRPAVVQDDRTNDDDRYSRHREYDRRFDGRRGHDFDDRVHDRFERRHRWGHRYGYDPRAFRPWWYARGW